MAQIPVVSTRRQTLSRGLVLLGAGAMTLALANYQLHVAKPAFGWVEASLLIVGSDLAVAGLVVSELRKDPPIEAGEDLGSMLLGAVADGLMLLVIWAALAIVLFGQSKAIERLDYFFAILVVVPLSVALGWRRRRLGATIASQRLLAYLTLATTAVVLLLARLLALPAAGVPDTSLFLLLALVGTRAAIALSARLPRRTSTKSFSVGLAAAGAPLILAAAILPFVPSATLDAPDIAIALAAGVVTFYLVRTYGGRYTLRSNWIRALDVGILVICTLVVVYLGKPYPNLAANQNYFLGPATDVLHGHPMLVGTFSQYGVGLIDVLAAIFLVVPIGYGTFTILLSAFTALLFVVLYTILRWSTESLPIAALGLSVAVILYIFGQVEFYASFPSTGVLRFGLPWLVIVCSLAAIKMERRRRLFDALLLAIVAIAAAWSGEAGVYCLGTAGAIACLDTAIENTGLDERLRVAIRRIAKLFAASIFGLLAFTVLTRLTAGAWADWGAYLEYIRLYTVGGFGTLPIEPWSPGLALGAMYTISAITIVLLAITRPAFIRERALSFRAAAGLTVLGALVYTYFLGRAAPNNLIHVSPPAVALTFVWLGIIRSASFPTRAPLAIASAVAVFLGAMIIASETEDIDHKYPSTALAAVLGGAPPLNDAMSALWGNPVVDPAAAHAAEFISSLPEKGTSLTIMLTPIVTTETLIRLDAANAVGSSNTCQESLSLDGPQRAAKAVRSLPAGGIVVMSRSAEDAGKLSFIQGYTFALLQARFKLDEIASDGRGMVAYQMLERRPAVAPHATAPPPEPGYGCA
jgi:hypothetical protein